MTSDAFALGATLFEPVGEAKGTVIVHGATAVPASYYGRFAQHLARSGLRVLTYDYRGIGASRPGSLRGFRATMTDWADKDARSAHLWVSSRFPSEPVAVVGHSFGGQLLGLIDEPGRVAGALLVASQFGYFGHWPIVERWKLGFVWHALVPALTRSVGYLPGGAGLGEDLPRGVAEEWALWCRSPHYLASHHPDAEARFARFDRPLLAYSFTDDDYAPRRAVDALLGRFARAGLDHRRVGPEDHGGKPIGHFGFFKPRFGETLWADAAAFLGDVLAGREWRGPVLSPPRWGIGVGEVLADLHWGRT